MKLMKNKKIFATKNFTKGTCTCNSRFYVEGQQELYPFYMLIPYGNAFCADSSMERQINRNSNIYRALYLIKELCILIIELSYSNIELSNSIKELSNTTYPIRELFNRLIELCN